MNSDLGLRALGLFNQGSWKRRGFRPSNIKDPKNWDLIVKAGFRFQGGAKLGVQGLGTGVSENKGYLNLDVKGALNPRCQAKETLNPKP